MRTWSVRGDANIRPTPCTLIDVENPLKATCFRRAAVLLTLFPTLLAAQTAPAASAPPPSTGGFFPLSEVHRGLRATAWTVFSGTTPEPMDVEILGILRGARGPGHDMILAQLHGAKPEYTGVVAGMSGSPVYVGDKLLGSLSYRIGEFSKDPIAGITPIAQMLEVRDLPLAEIRGQGLGVRDQGSEIRGQEVGTTNFQAMETPLTMSGFRPEAIKLWQQKMAGTGLEMVAAGGGGSSSAVSAGEAAAALASVVPGSLLFLLHDTYGFPPDLTADIARERGLAVDMAGYEREMESQRERARAASRFGVDLRADVKVEQSSEFLGYERDHAAGSIVALLRDGQAVQAIEAGERAEVILDRTPFYAESGGQVGDTGELLAAGARFLVQDTRKRGAA